MCVCVCLCVYDVLVRVDSPCTTTEQWSAHELTYVPDVLLYSWMPISADTANTATNSGSTGGRYWFGYLFRGGPTTSEDYERHDAVEDSIVYTLSDEDFAALKKAGDL